VKRWIFVSTVVAAIIATFALSLTRSPHIPPAISNEEYRVYSEWTGLHFGKNPPKGQLYVLSRTFKFNPTEKAGACRDLMIGKARVPALLTRQLEELGDAEYLFQHPLTASLQLPWQHVMVDATPDREPGTFHLLAFSRVAFSRNRREALFAFSDACAGGECGRGGVVYGYKQQGQWTFKTTGCIWLY
jgi:hypothetical protein